MLLAAGPTRRDGPRCSSASRHPCHVEGSAVRNVEESLAHGVHHGVHAGAHLELLQNVAHMVLNGVLADEQPLADLPVVQTLRDEVEHLELPRGHPRRRRLLPIGAGQLLELVEQLDRHRGGDQRLPVGHHPQGMRDRVDGGVLENVAGRTVLDRVVKVGLLVADRQHDDSRGRRDLLDRQARLDPGPLRHPDVHQDHVWCCERGHLGRGDTVPRLPHHLDVVLGGEQHRQTSTEELMIVDDRNPDGSTTGSGTLRRLAHEGIMTRLTPGETQHGHRGPARTEPRPTSTDRGMPACPPTDVSRRPDRCTPSSASQVAGHGRRGDRRASRLAVMQSDDRSPRSSAHRGVQHAKPPGDSRTRTRSDSTRMTTRVPAREAHHPLRSADPHQRPKSAQPRSAKGTGPGRPVASSRRNGRPGRPYRRLRPSQHFKTSTRVLDLAGFDIVAKTRAVPGVFVAHALAGSVALVAGALQLNAPFGDGTGVSTAASDASTWSPYGWPPRAGSGAPYDSMSAISRARYSSPPQCCGSWPPPSASTRSGAATSHATATGWSAASRSPCSSSPSPHGSQPSPPWASPDPSRIQPGCSSPGRRTSSPRNAGSALLPPDLR